jgi:hypothetical protein
MTTNTRDNDKLSLCTCTIMIWTRRARRKLNGPFERINGDEFTLSRPLSTQTKKKVEVKITSEKNQKLNFLYKDAVEFKYQKHFSI